MRAPVYRNIESKTTFLGVGLEEALFVMAVCIGLMMALPHNAFSALVLTGVIYAAIRLVNAGRAPSYAQHWFAYQLRSLLSAGHFSAGGRSRCPHFPFAPYHSRDVAPGAPRWNSASLISSRSGARFASRR